MTESDKVGFISQEARKMVQELVNTLCQCPGEHGSRVKRDCETCLASAFDQYLNQPRQANDMDRLVSDDGKELAILSILKSAQEVIKWQEAVEREHTVFSLPPCVAHLKEAVSYFEKSWGNPTKAEWCQDIRYMNEQWCLGDLNVEGAMWVPDTWEVCPLCGAKRPEAL